MPKLVEKELCCGCSACYNACGKDAIRMIADATGFMFPQIDCEKCINCGLCENACPGLKPAFVSYDSIEPKALIVQHKDNIIRYQSTSGGAFTAIAEFVIGKGGVVFGASMNDEMFVEHTYVEDVEELARFRNSKYVQSFIGNSYKRVETILKEGRFVCFSGTPCQIHGLKKYLSKDYPNLLLVDIACKSVPSPLIFRKYVQYRRSKNDSIKTIVFRDKKRGYSFCTLACYSDPSLKEFGKSVYRQGSESDEWLRLFLGGYCSRLSCFDCQYQNNPRVADLSLGDYWEPRKITPNMNDNSGTTTIAVWSSKGANCLEEIRDRIICQEYPFAESNWSKNRGHVKRPDYDRKIFFEDANTMDATSFFSKYVPSTLKVYFNLIGRWIIWKLNLHNAIRKIKHYIIHR